MCGNKSHPDHAKVVTTDIRELVGEYRGIGHKTVSALVQIATHCGLAPRRVRTFFFQDRDALVSAQERRSVCLSIATTFDHLADEFEARADRCRDKADAIRHRENRQLDLWGNNDTWGNSGSWRRKLAA